MVDMVEKLHEIIDQRDTEIERLRAQIETWKSSRDSCLAQMVIYHQQLAEARDAALDAALDEAIKVLQQCFDGLGPPYVGQNAPIVMSLLTCLRALKGPRP